MQAEDDSTPLRPTRASFVRGLPESMPVEEVIERGREAGIQLNPSDVHSARYYMRQEALAKLSSRPVTVLQPASVSRAAPEKPKPEPKQTSFLGLHAATSGKERGNGSIQRAQAPAPGKVQRAQARTSGKAQRAIAITAAAVVAAATKKPAKQSGPQARVRGSLEEQLRQIVMRIGTERARRIIDDIENLKV